MKKVFVVASALIVAGCNNSANDHVNPRDSTESELGEVETPKRNTPDTFNLGGTPGLDAVRPYIDSSYADTITKPGGQKPKG